MTGQAVVCRKQGISDVCHSLKGRLGATAFAATPTVQASRRATIVMIGFDIAVRYGWR